MSNDTDIDKSLERQRHQEREAFDYTLKGDADNVGIIAKGSAAGANIDIDPKTGKKKAQNEIVEAIRWQQELENLQNKIQDIIDGLKDEINAATALRNMMRKDNLDFSNPDILLLIKESGMDLDKVKEHGAEYVDAFIESKKDALTKAYKLQDTLDDVDSKTVYDKVIVTGEFTDEALSVFDDVETSFDDSFESEVNFDDVYTPPSDAAEVSFDDIFESSDEENDSFKGIETDISLNSDFKMAHDNIVVEDSPQHVVNQKYDVNLKI